MNHVLLHTFGSLGDLHPYLALGLGLAARGHRVTVATTRNYRDKIEAEGLGFRPVRPDFDPSDPALLRRVMDARRGTAFVMNELYFPNLHDSYADLVRAARDIDLLISHSVTYASPLVAETQGVPWAPPPVVFTLGSAAVAVASNFYGRGLEAALQLGCRAVFLLGRGGRERLPRELPPQVLALEYAPYSALFPRSAAVVHQGGIGTTAQALRAGIPALVVPFAHDQFDNAARVRRLGVGEALSIGRYRADRVARLLERLLSGTEIRQSAARLGEQLRAEDGLSRAVREVEAVLAGDAPQASRVTPPPD